MLKKYILNVFIVMLSIQGQQIDFQDFHKYQNKVSYEKIIQRLKYMEKDAALTDYYDVSTTSFKLYASKENKKNNICEYELQLAPKQQVVPSIKKLSDMRIAIDPGHIGGTTYCFLESRYIFMDPKTVGGREDIHFHEGELALLTALHLKKRLEEKGAEVMLTREYLGQSVYEKDFFSWLRDDFRMAVEDYIAQIDNLEERARQRSWWLTRSDLWSLFRKFYNPLDLQARANKINNFMPDITIVIHYNVGSANNEHGQNIGSDENYNMAFVGGSFLAGELAKPIERYHFLRLLVSNDFDSSVKLSQSVVNKFTEELNVPLLTDPHKANYLQKYCVATEAPGVYARNLTLTRLVHGAICYGESLYQDNLKESVLLATKDDEIAGIKVSHRIKQVAEAYFKGILDYCNKQ